MKVTKKLWSTAYHEAGHAAVAFELRVTIKKATIEPEGDSWGHISHHNLLHGKDIEQDNSNTNRWRMEKLVMVALAGRHAEKRFNPKGVSRHSDDQDRHDSVDLLSYFCGGTDEIEAYFKLLDLWTQGHLRKPWVWIGVKRLAEALIEHDTLKGRQARKILQEARQEYFGAVRGKGAYLKRC